MRALFTPASALMWRLRYRQKFVLIGLLLSLPFMGVVWLLVAEMNSQGVEYIEPVSKLLQHVQQHRGMAGVVLGGDASFKDKLLGKLR